MKKIAKRMNLTKETLRALEDRMVHEVAGGVRTNVSCDTSCISNYTCVCITINSNCC
jgi:hypothetical protein